VSWWQSRHVRRRQPMPTNSARPYRVHCRPRNGSVLNFMLPLVERCTLNLFATFCTFNDHLLKGEQFLLAAVLAALLISQSPFSPFSLTLCCMAMNTQKCRLQPHFVWVCSPAQDESLVYTATPVLPSRGGLTRTWDVPRSSNTTARKQHRTVSSLTPRSTAQRQPWHQCNRLCQTKIYIRTPSATLPF
jgi:hypothetical protein